MHSPGEDLWAVFFMEYQITAVTAQQRNPNRVNIFLDGEYAFSLAKIIAAWLQKGQMIDERKIEQLQEADSEEKAFQKALVFIGYRPRSETEVQERLKKAGFSPEVIQKVQDRLIRSGILGDDGFSRVWIENRAISHPRSRRMLAFELRRKGVEESKIEEALSSAPDDRSMALEIGRKYARRLAMLDESNFRKRLMGFLARKGFGYDTIQDVTRTIWAELHKNNGASTGENIYE
jgi:regulatory protein